MSDSCSTWHHVTNRSLVEAFPPLSRERRSKDKAKTGIFSLFCFCHEPYTQPNHNVFESP